MNKEIEEIKSTLIRMDERQERMDERQDKANLLLERNTVSLEHHIARTDLLEDYVKNGIVEKDLSPIKKQISDFRAGLKAIMWFCVCIGGIGGFLLTLKQLGVF